MIQANELRIGNFVWDNYGGIYKVVNINSEGFDYIDAVKPTFKAIGRYELDSIKPIPLTEEWLVRFGYKGLDQGYCLLSLTLLLSITKIDDKRFILVDATTLRYKSSPFEYVHQFQNLFYCLCGKELELSQ